VVACSILAAAQESFGAARPLYTPAVYARTVRPLTDQEQRRLRSLLARTPRLSLASPRLWIVGVGASGVLWIVTVLASKLVFWRTVLWLALAILMPLWIGWGEHRRNRTRRRGIESALATNRVEEIRVATTQAVALDEMEDLGEAWAFQIEPDRILFFGPRQDLPRGFPTTDFSYAELRDAGGNPVDARFTLRGEELAPVRRVPADAQRGLDLSRDLDILPGRLDRLETLLRSGL
jgi:hypothetical protein